MPPAGKEASTMDIQKLLNCLQTAEEHNRLEAKTGNEISTSLMETVCAYANTIHLNGGYILLGVSETGTAPKYALTGIKNPETLQNTFASQCRTKFNIPIRPEIETTIIHGKTVIGIYVPETDPVQKPVYIEKLGQTKGTFIRIAGSDHRCTDTDLARLYQERTSKPYDSIILENLSLQDLNPTSIGEYRRLRRLVDPRATELDLDDQNLLLSLKCISETNGTSHPTLTGLILFGKREVLMREYPMLRFDYIRMPGTQWDPGITKSYYTLEINDSLFSLLPRAESAIMDDIPRTIDLPESGLIRDEYPAIPTLAIREALVNTVMHRDYRTHSPIQVIRYSDRIEFRNAGHSLKPHPENGMPGSMLRNPGIANILHETKYAENKGTGIAIMINEMQKANLPVPTFISDRENNSFVATVFLHNLAGGEEIAWLTQFKKHNLTNQEIQVLLHLKEKTTVKNAECREIINIDQLGMSNILKHLRIIGILDKHGGGGSVYYTLSPEYQMPLKYIHHADEKSGELLSINSENNAKFTLLGKTRTDTEKESGELPAMNTESNPKKTLLGKTRSDSEKESDELPSINTENNSPKTANKESLQSMLPLPIQNKLKTLSRRVDKETMMEHIAAICSNGRTFSAKELSILLSRTEEWIQVYLNEMVSNHQLEIIPSEKSGSRNRKYHTIHDKNQSNLGQF